MRSLFIPKSFLVRSSFLSGSSLEKLFFHFGNGGPVFIIGNLFQGRFSGLDRRTHRTVINIVVPKQESAGKILLSQRRICLFCRCFFSRCSQGKFDKDTDQLYHENRDHHSDHNILPFASYATKKLPGGDAVADAGQAKSYSRSKKSPRFADLTAIRLSYQAENL